MEGEINSPGRGTVGVTHRIAVSEGVGRDKRIGGKMMDLSSIVSTKVKRMLAK